MTKSELKRCQWCGDDPLYQQYHDTEWGVPVTRDRKLFEFLILEGMQAGLSWITILRKRAAIKRAFANFDPQVLARFEDKDIQRCLHNPDIIRNRLKCQAAVSNAQAYLELREQGTRLSDFCWQFTDGQTLINRWRRHGQIPASTVAAEKMSKALKQQGFRFVGPTICYAFMQAVGMVNDHVVDCFRYQACCELAEQKQGIRA